MNKQQLQFFIGESDCGSFFALSPAEPYFCIKRDTEDGAVQAGLEAWSLFLQVKDGPVTQTREIGRKPFTSVQRSFIPKQVVFAEAC